MTPTPHLPLHWLTLLVLCLGLIPGAALHGISISSDGSDGGFSPASNIVVDLSLAPTATWDAPGAGNGVYDPAQWAIVFKFTEVDIPAGVTVTFANHPSRAPVIWLVQGSVNIAGTVVLDGATGHSGAQLRSFAEPGPGGFRGGRGSDAQTSGAGGLGPGGASYGLNDNHAGSGGGYAEAGGIAGTTWSAGAPGAAGQPYGNAGLYPLIGGSGGAGCANGSYGKGGGAGGGAILIATPTSIVVNGQIRANGGAGTVAGGAGTGSNRGSGGGSGGGIRLVAESVGGNGVLRALGGAGGVSSGSTTGGSGSPGRIRVEAVTNTLVDLGNPAYSMGVPEEPPRIFRDPATPAIRSVSLAGEEVPDDPRSRLSFPNTDLQFSEPGLKTLLIEAENVPVDGVMTVRVVRRTGPDEAVPAAFVSGSLENSTWVATIPVDGGFSTVQVHAAFAPAE